VRIEPPPSWMVRRWGAIVQAANDIGGWFEGYSNGYGFGQTDDAPADGVTSDPPHEMPVYDNWHESQDALDAGTAKKGDPHGTIRDMTTRGMSAPHVEYTFGTFCIFRATREENTRMNEGYEDTAGTENERFVEDGDHVIVVYMI